MKQILWDLLDSIPDYKEFLTLSELDESSRKLAAEHPDCVQLFEMGKTTMGRPILGLKIGSGSKNALFFGCPHPNEPIGTMLLEHLAQQLACSSELRAELDYTFYIIKAWDADGLVKNEGWLKGPFTLYNYSRNFFRPASQVQVDWTFPIDYKDLHFHATIAETKAMMELIDEIKPTFNYALHNAGFGGTYWYVSEDIPQEVYASLREASERQDIPLHLGEPESPSLRVLAPAVLLAEGIDAEYDFHEQFGKQGSEIVKIIKSGTSSDHYAREKYGTFTFLTELPYFFDPRISDLSEHECKRGEAIIESLDWTLDSNQKIEEILTLTRKHMSESNPYLLTIVNNIDPAGMDSIRKMASESPEYQRPATVAEHFDSVWLSRFYRLLAYGMLIRTHEYELESATDAGVIEQLRVGMEKADILHRELAEQLESKMDYSVIPIKKLINIQLECGLKAAQYIHSR